MPKRPPVEYPFGDPHDNVPQTFGLLVFIVLLIVGLLYMASRFA